MFHGSMQWYWCIYFDYLTIGCPLLIERHISRERICITWESVVGTYINTVHVLNNEIKNVNMKKHSTYLKVATETLHALNMIISQYI